MNKGICALFFFILFFTSCFEDSTSSIEESSSQETSSALENSSESGSSESGSSSELSPSSELGSSSETEAQSSSETQSSESLNSSQSSDGVFFSLRSISADGEAEGVVRSASTIQSLNFYVENTDGSDRVPSLEYYDLAELASSVGMDLLEFQLGMDSGEMVGAELILSDLCDGDYLLVLYLENSDGMQRLEEEFAISGEQNCSSLSSGEASSSATLPIATHQFYTLGAQAAVEPSALDLDAGMMYTVSERANHVEELDLAYGVQRTDSRPYLMTPARAEEEGFGYWGGADAADPLIFNVTDFIQEDLADLTEFPALPDVDYTNFLNEAAVEEGLILLLITDTDAAFLVQVNEVVDGTAGTVTVLARENAE
jgi:hypothetical protein